MNISKTWLLVLALSTEHAAADQAGWMAVEPPVSTKWEDSLPVYDTHRAALVLDSPATTRLRGTFLPKPLVGHAASVKKRVVELLDIFQKGKEATLSIEWLGEKPSFDGFPREIHADGMRVRSIYRSESTTLTRTVLCSREHHAIFIHLIADKPGALSFRVSLDGDAQIVDRRQLVRTHGTGLESHLWVLPFESDVASDGSTIVVRGEGEALIVWGFSDQKSPDGKISQLLAKLGERYDSGQQAPDPARIWQGVLATHLKSDENSP